VDDGFIPASEFKCRLGVSSLLSGGGALRLYFGDGPVVAAVGGLVELPVGVLSREKVEDVPSCRGGVAGGREGDGGNGGGALLMLLLVFML